MARSALPLALALALALAPAPLSLSAGVYKQPCAQVTSLALCESAAVCMLMSELPSRDRPAVCRPGAFPVPWKDGCRQASRHLSVLCRGLRRGGRGIESLVTQKMRVLGK